MATRVIDDSKLNDIAVAIQSKDSGGQMTVDEMVERIENIPSGSDFDITVTDTQVKMVIEVNDYDLSYWTRFGISGGGIVTVDWGDGTIESFTGDAMLEYAPQRKHNYQKAGRYLVTETVENGTLTIGSVNSISTLSEGKISVYMNQADLVRIMYNNKLKEINYGNAIVVSALSSIPFVIIHADVATYLSQTATDIINVKNGTAVIGGFWFQGTTAYKIYIPPSVTIVENYAFDQCKIRIIDFTDIQLNENGELPFVVDGAQAFRGSNSTILLFATQEIAEVAKNTTNLSVYADRIKYVGEV